MRELLQDLEMLLDREDCLRIEDFRASDDRDSVIDPILLETLARIDASFTRRDRIHAKVRR